MKPRPRPPPLPTCNWGGQKNESSLSVLPTPENVQRCGYRKGICRGEFMPPTRGYQCHSSTDQKPGWPLILFRNNSATFSTQFLYTRRRDDVASSRRQLWLTCGVPPCHMRLTCAFSADWVLTPCGSEHLFGMMSVLYVVNGQGHTMLHPAAIATHRHLQW